MDEGTGKAIEEMSIYEKVAAMRDEAAGKFEKDIKGIPAKGRSYDAVSEKMALSIQIPLYKKYRLVHFREKITTIYESENCVKIISTMVLVNLDNPEEKLRFEGIGTGLDGWDKDSGKASTYSVKDAIVKLLEGNSGLDPDLDSSMTERNDLVNRATALTDELHAGGYFKAKAEREFPEEPEPRLNERAEVTYEKAKRELPELQNQVLIKQIANMETLLKNRRK